MTDSRIVYSKLLRTQVESHRVTESWKTADIRGLAEENDQICSSGKYVVRGKTDTEYPMVVPPPARLSIVPCAMVARTAKFALSELCVASCDALSAALALTALQLEDGDTSEPAILSFANADIPGGRYRSGGRAQEEDLCRLLPPLYATLAAAPSPSGDTTVMHPTAATTSTGAYPIPAGTTLFSSRLPVVRRPGTYALCPPQTFVSVITAAMPCGLADKRPAGGWLSESSLWGQTVTTRIRSVLHTAAENGSTHIVLGAFGCGAFGNPPGPTARIFRQQLLSPEFRGQFRRVVFAIIDPVGTGNLKPFATELEQCDAASTFGA